jgi:hypothetical protein
VCENKPKIGIDTLSPQVYLVVMPEQLATDYLTTRVTPDIKEYVEEMASTERRTLSQATLILLEEAIAARVRKAKKQ